MLKSCLQASAVEGFLQVLRQYCSETLCKDLRSHTITNVQSNNDKVNYLSDEVLAHYAQQDIVYCLASVTLEP